MSRPKWASEDYDPSMTLGDALQMLSADMPEGMKPVTAKELYNLVRFNIIREQLVEQLYYLRTGKFIYEEEK